MFAMVTGRLPDYSLAMRPVTPWETRPAVRSVLRTQRVGSVAAAGAGDPLEQCIPTLVMTTPSRCRKPCNSSLERSQPVNRSATHYE